MIREKIKQAMYIRGISASEMSKSLGISKSILSSFLSGKSGIGIDKMESILDYLRIELVINLNMIL
ncbi:helix-turn-helix domain-containing protein [Bacteroides heparinolyticus]|uniref:helix-turn-helix domain-containing protein n=1 Tax=Prevotella heparinolytica TaxID=28113 RepID=UPI0035A02647